MTAPGPPLDIEAIVAELADNDGERTLMGRGLELLPFAAERIEPPPTLRERVMARIAGASRGATFVAAGDYFASAAEIAWEPLTDGIEVKRLFRDAATDARVTLVRMGPDLLFPEHTHDGVEDLFLIEGEAWVGDIPMRAGDYCRAERGTSHSHVRSGPSGACAFVVSR